MERKTHWEKVYAERKPDEVSWYQPEPRLSLRLIKQAAAPGAAVLDAGGGASVLVDRLLDEGFAPTVLDVSGGALAAARARLGARAQKVRWIEADVLSAPLESAAYDVWHDRAVFHFLIEADDRRRYAAQLLRALRPGGCAIIAAFSLSGPPKCSGLPVERYSPESLARELGAGLELAASEPETHDTPFGTRQEFVYCRFLRR